MALAITFWASYVRLRSHCWMELCGSIIPIQGACNHLDWKGRRPSLIHTHERYMLRWMYQLVSGVPDQP